MNNTSFDWYECIEEPVRELVFLLRNNGFNTECSCGHQMYIQCQYTMGYDNIMELHRLLCNYLNDKKMKVTFKIKITVLVDDGNPRSTLDIELNPALTLD